MSEEGSGANKLVVWGVIAVVFIIVNIILYFTTGWVIIPR